MDKTESHANCVHRRERVGGNRMDRNKKEKRVRKRVGEREEGGRGWERWRMGKEGGREGG